MNTLTHNLRGAALVIAVALIVGCGGTQPSNMSPEQYFKTLRQP